MPTSSLNALERWRKSICLDSEVPQPYFTCNELEHCVLVPLTFVVVAVIVISMTKAIHFTVVLTRLAYLVVVLIH